MPIIKLQAENFKRLHAVTIEPTGPAVTIAGRNNQGKSSTLDAIEAVIGGLRHVPNQPLRRGASKGRIELQTEALTATRTFTAKGGSALTVTNATGACRRPQEILDALYSALTFDPEAFARMKPDAQSRILAQIAGFDLDEYQQRHNVLYENRAKANANRRAAEARLGAMQRHENVPAEPVSHDALLDQITEADKVNAEHQRMRLRLQALREQSAALMAEHARAQAELEQLLEKRDALESERNRIVTLGKQVAAEVALVSDIDTEPLRAQLRDAEAINARVRDNAVYDEAAQELDYHRARADELDAELQALAAERTERLAAVKLPVDNLELGDNGPLLNGVPFEQASSSQRLACSAAIGFALNPQLKVLLIRHGSLLDAEARQMLERMAAEHGGQVWLECVGDGGAGAVVIEDGRVAETPAS